LGTGAVGNRGVARVDDRGGVEMAGDAPGAPTPGLRFHLSQRGGDALRVAVQGDIDYHNSAQLPRNVLAAVGRHHPRRVELDLSQVPFIDSSAMASLLFACRATRAAGAQFELTDVHADVRRMLEIAGLGPVLGLEPSPDGEVLPWHGADP
jgi:stage II sporulation protein AA (anti-sigma F factor antagonist)